PPVGVDNDPAYTRVDFPSGDATLKDNAIYAVLANGGTGDPASTWYFDQRPTGGSWLATSLSLNAAGGSPPPPPPPPPPTTGNLTVSTSTTGAGIPASYTATVDGGQSQSTPTTGSVTFTSLSAGSHTVVLAVASNCTVTGGASRTVTVPAGGTATVSYTVVCVPPITLPLVNAGPDQTAVTGLLYSFSWSFSDAGNDGPWRYTITWGDGSTSSGTATQQGALSASHTYITILPRAYTITVSVTDAAGQKGSDTKSVSVLLL